jgi:heme-degrading monooxygenase HmoA
MADVQKAPGLVGLQIARSEKCHYGRTLTVWKDADALMAFVTSPNHAAAVAHATQTGDAEAVVSWEMSTTRRSSSTARPGATRPPRGSTGT